MGSDPDRLLEQFPKAGAGLKSMLLAETPAREVTVPPFRIDRCEVTNSQFERFVKARPEWGKRDGRYLHHWEGRRTPSGQGDHPVTYVTWRAAMAYAEWAGKRLPSEAEWEFAARGGVRDAKYPWGNREPSPDLANYAESGTRAPVRTGRFPPNPYGLFDLAGNVWEFCLDPWQAPYPAGAAVQTEAALRRMRDSAAERRVIRGGSFDGGPFNMRVTARDSHRADDPVAHVGFRCAISG